jgi:hypothetical protein
VRSTPARGSDWYQISETWINQRYPIGSFVQHFYDGKMRHYRKIVIEDAQPGPNPHIWSEVEEFTDEAADELEWRSRVYNLHEFVRYNNNYYISVINNNIAIPTGPGWQLIPAFDPALTVPTFTGTGANADYPVGAFVRHNGVHYIKTASQAGTPPNMPWLRVQNWNDASGVPFFDTNVNYATRPLGTLVRHMISGELLVFELIRTTGNFPAQPQDDPTYWRRVLKWSETQVPAEWTPGVFPAGRFFRFTHPNLITVDYYATMETTRNNQSITTGGPSGNAQSTFSRVQQWNPTQLYIMPAINNAATERYHCWTDEPDGTRAFWVRIGTAGGVGGGISGAANRPTDDHPLWRRHVFTCQENIIISEVAGHPAIWRRTPLSQVTNPSGSANPSPSMLFDDWTRVVAGVTERYVFTVYDEIVTLWETGVFGTEQEPGRGTDWTMVDFRTGREFVLTENAVGMKSFWRSATQSSTRPAPGSSVWQMLNQETQHDARFVYMARGGTVVYLDTESDSGWLELSNAWIGGTYDTMFYHFSVNNIYQPGDIVVFGSTLTDTYRYFRFRAGANPIQAAGLLPSSPMGLMFWEPIDVFNWP